MDAHDLELRIDFCCAEQRRFGELQVGARDVHWRHEERRVEAVEGREDNEFWGSRPRWTVWSTFGGQKTVKIVFPI